MIDFILKYIEKVIQFIQFEWFLALFMAFVGVFAVKFVKSIVWGR